MNEASEQHPDALLADYAIDNLPEAQRESVARHLAACARCRARLQALEATADLLRRLPAPNLPRSFVLPATAATSAAARRRPALWLMPASFLSAAAVLFLALGLSLAAPRPSSSASYAAAPAPAMASANEQNSAAATIAAAGLPESSSAFAARAAPAAQEAASAHAGAAAVAPAAAEAEAPPPQRDTVAPGVSPPTAATPTHARLLPYQVLLIIGGIACLLVGLGATLRAARR